MAHGRKSKLLQTEKILEKLKLIFNILIYFVYVFICVCITLFLGYIGCLILVISMKNYPFQTITFLILSLGAVVVLWSLLFVKMKFFKKFLGFVLLLLIIKFLFILPAVNYAFEVDTCIDIGVCKEGIETKIDGQLIEINKENCLLHNKEWDDNINSCYVR